MTDRKESGRWDRTALTVAIVTATVTIGGVAVGYWIARENRTETAELAAKQRTLEMARIRLQIINAVNDYDQPTAALLMDFVLRPNDESPDFTEFSRRYRDLVAERAPGATAAATDQYQKTDTGEETVPQADIVASVRLFSGDERLVASNRLVALYPIRKKEVVRALTDALVTERDRPFDAYRINLYVAFTLARIVPSWEGSKEQVAKIRQLTASRFYKDSTFKRRVDEALAGAREV